MRHATSTAPLADPGHADLQTTTGRILQRCATALVLGETKAEDAALLVLSQPAVYDALAAVPVLDQLRARHQPVRLAADSDVVVCSCTRRIAYDACPDAQLLGGAR